MVANDTTFIHNLRREVLAAYAEKGHKITVVAQVLSFREELEQQGYTVIDTKMSRRGTDPLADIKLLADYITIFKKQKPDLVLTNNIKPNVYAGLACRLLKIPYIVNVTGLGTAVEKPGKMQALTTTLYKMGVAGAKSVLFQNSENEAFFRDRNMLGAKSKTVLLPGSGVNLQTHPVLPYPQGERVHFLFVARVMKEKGIDQYLETAKTLRSERQDVVFHVCGSCDDPVYEEVLKEAHTDGVIEYHGQQKDMLPFWQQAACIVNPSYYPEGMSNVLLEAAACGRPIIVADRSGCRETVEPGKTGYLVPTQDTQAVIDAVRDFLNLSWEQRQAMGLAGRAKMEKEFDRRIVVEKYMEEL